MIFLQSLGACAGLPRSSGPSGHGEPPGLQQNNQQSKLLPFEH